jgi:Xaa-Pro aminopeptidase
VILDTAPIVNGYRADFTMTLCVDQPLTPQQASIEAALHSAMDACASTLRPGVACADIHSAMWRAFDEAGWAAHILHHAGHGLGLGHPEPPFLVPHSQETLVSGDIIALEPGLYGPDWGARIEHIYRITEDGHERLTAHSTHFAPGAG